MVSQKMDEGFSPQLCILGYVARLCAQLGRGLL